ncbi:MAG: YHS domain-containing protein [Dehalococcoidia bacterium]|nr:YHS domain-containing protein [Dehalococcoidia bacterium]
MVGKLLSFGKKDLAEDPVCHMKVDKTKPGGGTFEHKGTMYYFCGPGCRVAFSKEPEAYLSGQRKMKM